MFNASALTLHSRFKNGEISAKEIAHYTFARIETFDPQIEAFLQLYKTRALQQAEKLDQKRAKTEPLGKLAGIPIALKDNMHVKGEITTCASRFLANYRALFDATVTRLLEEEDALLIGKTNLDEFAMGSSTENSAYQITRNPWHLDYSPGGSSGGSAAAVAACFTPYALGSDTGGSIRQPAALCGVVGFKPTYGAVSRYGLVAFASSLDQIGPFSRTVEESAYLMEVIAKPCSFDSTSLALPSNSFCATLNNPIKGESIGVYSPLIEKLSPDLKENFYANLKKYEELGANIVEVDLSLIDYSIAIYYIIATAEASTNLARFDGIRYGVRSERARTIDELYSFSKQEGFGWEVKNRILLGTYVLSSGYSDAYYKHAQKIRTLVVEQFNKAFAQCAVIALPTCPPDFKLGAIKDPLEMYLQDLYTISANMAGLPAISIPSGFSKNKMPLALQLMGPRKEDANLLRFAHQFEQAHRHATQIPPLFDKEHL